MGCWAEATGILMPWCVFGETPPQDRNLNVKSPFYPGASVSLLDLLRLKKGGMELDEGAFRIEDSGHERTFKYGDITYSKVRTGGIYTREYWDYFIPVAYAFDRPKVLLIGLGGGTVAFQLTSLLQKNIDFDAVELSRKAVELSQQFIPKNNANIMFGEGADYVAATNKRYDAIMLDAYASYSIPERFFQRKFIQDAHRALAPDGLLAINYAMNFMGIVKLNSFVSRLKEKFFVYKINTAVFESNVIILCSKKWGKSELMRRIESNLKKTDDNEFLFNNYRRMSQL